MAYPLTIRTGEQLTPFVKLFGEVGFWGLILTLALLVYFDDIQITEPGVKEIPTIYNIRIGGIKIIDGISIALIVLVSLYLLFQDRFPVTSFHKYVGTIFLVYCYAGLVGFIYSFIYNYDYRIWLQDFQQIVYMTGFFLITFFFLDTRKRWKIFVICFLAFLVAKNILIFYNSLTGIGIFIGGWAFRASQNSEFAYFPMMFFPLVLLFLTRKTLAPKILLALLITIYLFNSLIGIYRTVWVMIMLGSLYLLTQLDREKRRRLTVYGLLGLGSALVFVAIQYPKFLEIAWNYRFASIFEWSLEGDRSNATRLLEIINTTHRVFENFAFIQGMGLGAWWDDSARRLLPDLGAGFTFKTRFHTTHMLLLTQFLKIGLIGILVYWTALYKMFSRISQYARAMDWARWEKSVILGLNIGLLCAFISNADFVRLFTMIGINIGITSSRIYLDRDKQVSIT